MSKGGVEQPKIYRSTTNIIPYKPVTNSNSPQFNNCRPMTRQNVHPTQPSNSMLIATVNGRAVGEGSGTLFTSINGGPDIRTLPSGPNGATSVNASDPQVRKLVYNMYRGLLSIKHERATDIVDGAPQQNIKTDEGVNDRVISMMKQKSEIGKEGKMNYGPPPPPPPPPFQTGAPPVRLPSEIAAAAAMANKPLMASPPMMAPPAALAGAMLKDKKPFTYTPGGLNLAEINGQVEQNGTPVMPSQFRGSNDIPIQSRSFKVIQNAYDGSPDPIGSVSLEELRDYHQPELRKYAGSSIPSRSFRMLQAMTDTEEGEASVSSLRGKPPLEENTVTNGKPTSKSCSPLQHSTSSPLTSAMSSPPLTPCTSSMSIPSSCDIGSKFAPAYTSIRDSPAYRQVAPKILKEGDKEDRVVNSALSSRRENSPRPWHLSASSRSLSPVSSQGVSWSPDVDTRPRLLNFLQQEKQISETTPERDDGHHLYDGNKIPSRVFRQLQNDYSKENDPLNNGIGVKITEVPLPRLMKHLNLDRNTRLSVDDDGSSSASNPDCDNAHMNEMLETAEAKGSVLKELTSHFDPQTSLKKPRAAPGRVFRYLQQQYDDPLDTGLGSTCSSSPVGNRSGNGSPIPGNRSRNVSPPNDRSSSISSMSAESGHFELEPKPYVGARIPGRTFRLLQENYDTHPSVIQARK